MRRSTWATTPTLLVLAGCIGDPPVAPDVAPLEVVADTGAAQGQRCVLNRPDLGVGVHEVLVIAQGDAATVTVAETSGEVALESGVDAGSATSTSVHLPAGSYVVTCAWPSGDSERVDLRVD